MSQYEQVIAIVCLSAPRFWTLSSRPLSCPVLYLDAKVVLAPSNWTLNNFEVHEFIELMCIGFNWTYHLTVCLRANQKHYKMT